MAATGETPMAIDSRETRTSRTVVGSASHPLRRGRAGPARGLSGTPQSSNNARDPRSRIRVEHRRSPVMLVDTHTGTVLSMVRRDPLDVRVGRLGPRRELGVGQLAGDPIAALGESPSPPQARPGRCPKAAG